MFKRLGIIVVGVFTFMAVSGGVAHAQNKCAGSKINATCKKEKCKANLESKQAKTGDPIDPAKVAKCEQKFSDAFAKAEDKGGCITTGDVTAIEAKVDAFVADVQSELDVATGTNPNKCEAAKIKAAGKKAACKCKLESKQAKTGDPIDAAKVAKCEQKFSDAFAKAEDKGGCNTTGDTTVIEAKVDAFVADVDDELPASSPSGAFLDGAVQF